MFRRTRTPRPPLSNFVEMFWQYEGPGPPHAQERCLPTGTVEIVVDLGDTDARAYDRRDADRRRGVRGPLVCGAHSDYFVVDTAGHASTVGVHFKPGGAFAFLGSAAELRNALVPLEALWGARAAELRDRLLDAATAEARFDVLEQALFARATRPQGGHRAVSYALQQFGSTRPPQVSEIARRCGLSQRRFIRVFDEEVGLTPKLFCRVQRFQRALRRIEAGKWFGWADAALECGYSDQAHLIHDFRAFSGVSPTSYLANRGDHRNHLPQRDQGQFSPIG